MSPNAPRRLGARGAFEIWFLCIFDPAARRALWLRLTTRTVSDGAGEAIAWAASFDRDASPLALKRIAPVAELVSAAGTLRLGEVELGDGFTRGEVKCGARSIAWDVRYALDPPAPRRLLDRLPLPVHVEHGAVHARFEGWIAHDGARHTLGPETRGIQQHIWGEDRQADEIFWMYAPGWDGAPDGFGEIASAKLRRDAPLPRVTTVRVSAPGLEIAHEDIPRAFVPRVTCVGPGRLEIRASSLGRVLIARAEAPPETLAGYVYRDPRGGEVHVAQSDVATLEIEIYRRAGAMLRPERLLSAPIAALEIHRPDRLAGVDYLAWTEAGPVPRAPAPIPAHAALPTPSRIVALGLTYADHLRETSSPVPPEPIVFPKHARTWLPEGDTVRVPTTAEILDAVASIDPALSHRIRDRFAFVPPIMDYEIELGLMVLENGRRGAPPRIGLFLANDVTARACQALGSAHSYWSIAKSFSGFLPVGPTLFVPPLFDLDRWPDIRLVLRVNGEVRQDGLTRDLVYTPRQVLAAAARSLGADPDDLPEGTAILTGTPAGVAFRVARWKRAVGERFLDPIGRLGAAIDLNARAEHALPPRGRHRLVRRRRPRHAHRATHATLTSVVHVLLGRRARSMRRRSDMAIGMIFEGKGVTKQQYEQVKQAVMPNDKLPTGMRSHVAGPAEGGWNVIEIWESEADARRFFVEKLEKELKRAGISAVPRSFHVHALIDQHTIGGASAPDFGTPPRVPGPAHRT